MTFNEFAKNISRDVEITFSDISIEIKEIEKPMAKYRALVVKPKSSDTVACLNLDKVYSLLDIQGYDKIREDLLKSVKEVLATSVNTDFLTDYEKTQARIVCQVIGTKNHFGDLAGIPHREYEDISMVYKIIIDDDPKNLVSTMVTNSMLKQWGISSDLLHINALRNSEKVMPATFAGIGETLKEFGADLDIPEESPQISVLTNTRKMFGAAALFYPGMMKRIAERLGEDYYILPSSIHEVLIVRKSMGADPDDLCNMVKSINETEVRPEDRLTDSVYSYNVGTCRFEKIR